MNEHPHLAVFGRIHDAFMDGDLDSLAAMFEEHVVWHTPGRNPLAGDYEGRDAVLASFAGSSISLTGPTAFTCTMCWPTTSTSWHFCGPRPPETRGRST